MAFTITRLTRTALFAAFGTTALFVALAQTSARETLNFNDGWSFALVAPDDVRSESIRSLKIGDAEPQEKTGEAKRVRLPHDWAIERGFDASLDGATGKTFWRGVGVYRHDLHVDASDADKRFVLGFDGVMSFPEVFVNGRYAGGWDYGYLGFQVDITPFLKSDADNLIEVRCDTREHRSRWYPGAGIYRGVELIECSKDLWLPQGAVIVTTPRVEPETPVKGSALVKVETTPEIARDISDATVCLKLIDPSGQVVFEKESTLDLKANLKKNEAFSQANQFPQYEDASVCAFEAMLTDAVLWDVDAPRMYRAEVCFKDAKGNVLDEYSTRFGIRLAEWTLDDGFHLNGRRVQLNGVDLHHDQGLIGAASHPAAVRRQLSIMRDMGANAIRTSHNPNSSAFMDACDEMGFIVWNELFDKWDGTAGLRREDDFYSFAERQARQFARRDRNRPSVCAWSIGNEIADVETNRAGSSNPSGDAAKRVEFLHDAMKRYDATRRVGMGCFVESAIGDYPPKNPVLAPLDISGWNYGGKYRFARASFPNMPLVYTESSSAFSTRGYYDLRHPEKKDQYDDKSLQVDSYDLISANGPRDIPDVDFERMLEDRYVAGEFVWTGFDYIGEPAPFERTAKVSYFGIVDLCGVPKDRFWLYRSHWNDKDVTAHIVPHWTWNADVTTNVPVYVYTSGDSAELFLNGKSLGVRHKDKTRTFKKPKDASFDLPDYYWIVDKFRLRWENVSYEPGVLEAVCYKDGQEIGRSVVKTAGKVAALKATPEKQTFESNDDLIYVEINAVDEEGTICPNAATRFTVDVEGPATVAGLGTGDPIDLDSFADLSHSLFYGSATLVLRSTSGWDSTSNGVRVRIKAESLDDVVLNIGQ